MINSRSTGEVMSSNEQDEISSNTLRTSSNSHTIKRNSPQPQVDVLSCMVCSETKTAEWRRGPSGRKTLCNADGLVFARRCGERRASGLPEPTTIDEIEEELRQIANDRFKSKGITIIPPSNVRQRIAESIKKTKDVEAQKVLGEEKNAKAEKQAAELLVGLSRITPPISTTSRHFSSPTPSSPSSPHLSYTPYNFAPLPRRQSSSFVPFHPSSPPITPPRTSSPTIVPSSTRMSLDYITSTENLPSPNKTNSFFTNFPAEEEEEEGS